MEYLRTLFIALQSGFWHFISWKRSDRARSAAASGRNGMRLTEASATLKAMTASERTNPARKRLIGL
jgi:hypothetical protein